MRALLHHLLATPPAAPAAEGSLRLFWQAHLERTRPFRVPIDRAIAGGFHADRLGFAFAAGYHAALAALVGGGPVIHALCATEEGGAHPRAIRTALAPDAGGRLRLTGKKRWATLAPEAEALLVVASAGVDETGRNRLRVVRVAADAPGVTVTPMPEPPFAPEIPHAEITLDAVPVDAADVLPGDGYDAYLKPFRTVEDLHVHGALLGYLLGAGRRCAWGEAPCERLAALLVATRALVAEPPDAPETHVALAGLLRLAAQIVADAEPLWQRADAAERGRWERDRPLLEVAGKARAARRERAWQRLGARPGDPQGPG